MSETKLKPCPFCGGEAYKKTAYPCDSDGLEMNMHIIGCENCGIEFSWLWNEECVIELWNTRKPVDDVLERLEKMIAVAERMPPDRDELSVISYKDAECYIEAYKGAIKIVKGVMGYD